jgi:hypothetical protein
MYIPKYPVTITAGLDAAWHGWVLLLGSRAKLGDDLGGARQKFEMATGEWACSPGAAGPQSAVTALCDPVAESLKEAIPSPAPV